MTDALAAWKAKACTDPITLPSGTVVTLRLPYIRDCLAAGKIPLSVVASMNKKVAAAAETEEAADLSPEEIEVDLRFDVQMVAHAVVTIDGEPASLTAEDVPNIPPADRAEILAYCTREFAAPKAS